MSVPSTNLPVNSRALRFGRYDYASFLAYFSYASASIAIPICLVAVATDLGLHLENGGMEAAGVLQLGRTFAIVATMLLSAFVAARWGKRRTLGLSVVLMCAGIALCALSSSYAVLFLSLAVAGFGEGGIEGLATPFVQELHPDDPGRYVNFSHAFWSIGVLVTVLIAGAALAQGVSWRLVVAIVSILALIPAILLLMPPRTGHAYPESTETVLHTETMRRTWQIIRLPRFWVFFAAMFVAGGGEFCLTFWSATYIQLHFTSSAWIGGIGTASFAAGMVLGRTGSAYLVRQEQLRSLIVYSAIAGTLVTVCLPVFSNLPAFLAALFLAGVATAPFWPSVQSLSVDRLPQADTTILMILLACAGIPGCGAATWLMGYVGDHFGGLANAFFIAPACMLILGVLIAGEGRSSHRTSLS